MRIDRRDLLNGVAASAAATLTASADCAAGQIEAVTPEQFGARGDGRTNDTDAFAAMAEFVTRRGGGEIALRPTTYIVGKQFPGGRPGHVFTPAKLIEISGCTSPLVIRGNGARLRCADGLRYGTFDPKTDQPTRHQQPYYGDGVAAPYDAMIRIEDCRGPVEVMDLELDGNLPNLRIGGPHGDTGWQIGSIGLRLVRNAGPERIVRVHSHHHPLDGLFIDGLLQRESSSIIEGVVCEYNGRQGCSVVAGRNYRFERCGFKHTGKGGLGSAPGAGVDIEAEVGPIRSLHFVECEFSNNQGCGMLAGPGDSAGATFDRCRFMGTTNWSAWPNKPRFRFVHCDFVGSLVHPCGSKDPEEATQFHDCEFRDDPALSPTGEVYNAAASHPIADVPFGENVLFNRCRFPLTHRAVLPWCANGVIFSNCVMSQVAEKMSYPRGIYLGRNRIDGNADLNYSRILGEVLFNGRLLPRTP